MNNDTPETPGTPEEVKEVVNDIVEAIVEMPRTFEEILDDMIVSARMVFFDGKDVRPDSSCYFRFSNDKDKPDLCFACIIGAALYRKSEYQKQETFTKTRPNNFDAALKELGLNAGHVILINHAFSLGFHFGPKRSAELLMKEFEEDMKAVDKECEKLKLDKLHPEEALRVYKKVTEFAATMTIHAAAADKDD